VVGTR
jgi:hypothetical protein